MSATSRGSSIRASGRGGQANQTDSAACDHLAAGVNCHAMDARTLLLVGAGVLAAQAMGAVPAHAEPRPQVGALRLSESDVLARFTPEVRSTRTLRDRALALWRTHFAAQAGELEGRFTTEEDWRPVLADAAALIDEFLEDSLLPRQGEWRAEGQAGEAGKVWVETLDPRTGQRVRQLRDPSPRRRLLAPVGVGDDAKPGQKDAGSRTDQQGRKGRRTRRPIRPGPPRRILLGTLTGFPDPPAMGLRRRSRLRPDAIGSDRPAAQPAGASSGASPGPSAVPPEPSAPVAASAPVPPSDPGTQRSWPQVHFWS